jgi:hypothetical protein
MLILSVNVVGMVFSTALIHLSLKRGAVPWFGAMLLGLNSFYFFLNMHHLGWLP